MTNRLYFVYFFFFWLIWVVVVFALLGSAMAKFIRSLPVASPSALVILLGAFAIASWGLVQLWKVTSRSPFIFSEPDAYLLCQTPVSRRSVGVSWFLMNWFEAVLPFAAVAVLLSFALTEAALPHAASLRNLPDYLAASLRALVIVVPLQMGVQAGMWGLGAFRLRRDWLPMKLRWLRLLTLPLGLGLLAAIFLPGWRTFVLAPLTFFLQAAFSEALPPLAWLIRAGCELLVLALGMASLLIWSDRMHLGRAAQETRLQSIIQLAVSTMNYEAAEIFRRQGRMKATRPPSWLPVRSGVWMLVWKDLVQTRHSLRASQVLRWIWNFSLGFGIFLASTWTVQLIIGGLWAVSLGSMVTSRLRNDLARWWLLRSLPLRVSNLLLAQLGPACGLGLLLGWLALALTHPPQPFNWLAAALLPFLVACAALGSARDILSHAKARVLMTPGQAEENVPRQDIQGVLIVLISVGIPLGMLAWSSFHSGWLILGILSLPVAALITTLIFQSVISVYRWIT